MLLSQIANFVTNNEWSWSPNSSDLNPLDYQAWGNARILLQTATKAENSSQVYRCTLADLVALPEKGIDNAVKDNRN